MKLPAQILIGTPKVLSSYRTMGLFDANDIELIVIKDPDVITSSNAVRENIIAPAKGAQFILFSTTRLNRKSLSINIDHSIMLDPYSELSPKITHFFVKCANFAEKIECLRKILIVTGRSDQVVVFCKKNDVARRLMSQTKDAAVAVAVTGDMSEDGRLKNSNKFRRGNAKALMTTNRLSRSIDVPKVKIVVNFDVPINVKNNTLDFKAYVQRVGCSGRFGKHIYIHCRIFCDIYSTSSN